MSREHRSSFRFSLPAGQERAVLRAGQFELRVKILNASATGFLLECPKFDGVAGDVLTLATTTGKCEIRVAFSETTSDHTRLGVQRIRDLDEPLQAANSIPWYSFLPGYHAAGGPGNLVVALLTLALLVVGSVYLVQGWRSSARPGFSANDTSRWLSRKLADADRKTRETVERICVSLWSSSATSPPTSAGRQAPNTSEAGNRMSANLTPDKQKKSETRNQ